MDEEKILARATDQNIERLEVANKALRGMLPSQREMQRQRQQPGSRPDGGMSAIPGAGSIHNAVQVILEVEAQLRNDMADARRLVDNFEEEQIRLESEIEKLKAELDAERAEHQHYKRRCEELKNILQQAASIMVNGNKAQDQ